MKELSKKDVEALPIGTPFTAVYEGARYGFVVHSDKPRLYEPLDVRWKRTREPIAGDMLSEAYSVGGVAD